MPTGPPDRTALTVRPGVYTGRPDPVKQLARNEPETRHPEKRALSTRSTALMLNTGRDILKKRIKRKVDC